MRPRRLSRLLREFALFGFAAAIAGCSSSATQAPLYTAGIPPRPNDGMVREAPPPAYIETGSLGAGPPPSAAAADPYGNYRWRPSTERPAIAPPPPAPSYDQAMRPDPARQSAPSYGRPIGGEAPPIRVREGDTLFSLASRHGVTVADLIAENHLNGVKIDVGQELKLPPPRH